MTAPLSMSSDITNPKDAASASFFSDTGLMSILLSKKLSGDGLLDILSVVSVEVILICLYLIPDSDII